MSVYKPLDSAVVTLQARMSGAAHKRMCAIAKELGITRSQLIQDVMEAVFKEQPVQFDWRKWAAEPPGSLKK